MIDLGVKSEGMGSRKWLTAEFFLRKVGANPDLAISSVEELIEQPIILF